MSTCVDAWVLAIIRWRPSRAAVRTSRGISSQRCDPSGKIRGTCERRSSCGLCLSTILQGRWGDVAHCRRHGCCLRFECECLERESNCTVQFPCPLRLACPLLRCSRRNSIFLTLFSSVRCYRSFSQDALLLGSRGLPGKTCVNVAKVNTDLEEPVGGRAAEHPPLVVIVVSSDGNSGPRATRGSSCFCSEYLDPDCLGRRSDNLKVQAFVRSEDGANGHDWGGRC